MTTSSSPRSARDLFLTLLDEASTPEQRASVFQSIVTQPISAALLAHGAEVLRAAMVPVELPGNAIDTCGTGGSGHRTFNTSTLTAFVVAAASGKVAKHGNRSASGNCGCFDLLEELGVKIDLTPDQECRVFDDLGIVFLFAPLHHPALHHVASLRKAHGKKTLFNLIGPLCNPARVSRQMIGTGKVEDARLLASTLQQLGSVGSIIVTGHDGLDEVTVTDTTTIRTVRDSSIEEHEFSPESLFVSLVQPENIRGGTPKENAEHFLRLAKGGGSEALRDLVLVNAAHALLVASMSETLSEAFARAEETLASGKVYELFCLYRDLSQRL